MEPARITEALVRGFYERQIGDTIGQTDGSRVAGCTEPTDREYGEHLAERIVHSAFHLARDGRELYPAGVARPAARVSDEQLDGLKALLGALDPTQRAEIAAVLGAGGA